MNNAQIYFGQTISRVEEELATKRANGLVKESGAEENS